jgi:hypothetical protein
MLPAWKCFSLVSVVLMLPAAVLAADPPKNAQNLAITKLADVDVDFAYQGEYLGTTFGSRRGREYAGLQVVALGGGKFDAVHYRGGLPGAGWDRTTKSTLKGELLDGTVSLVSPEFSVTVEPQQALLYDSGGRHIASLQKTQRVSPTMGAAPPRGATVLFDGTPPQNLTGANLTPEGLLMTGSTTKMPVGDFQLHVEFRTPYMPYARGQGRSNSGCYIQQRYEVQILDSFGLEGIENECGSLYRQRRPDVNMCLPPLSWQTYDIYFTAARFDDAGKKIANARITVLHNGEAVQNDYEIVAKTGAGAAEGPDPRPIHFQHHGNPVTFRNMWIVLDGAAEEECGQVECCPQRRGLLRGRLRIFCR